MYRNVTSPTNGRRGHDLRAGLRSDIVERLLAGDPRAFAEVYDAYRARLHTFLLRLTRDEQLARDLSQETWLRFAAHARQLAPDSEPSAWIFSVARNLFISQRRWLLLDRERLADWGFQSALKAPLSPLIEASDRELGRRVERAIAGLPLRYREVILLVAVEDFDNAQVATMLRLEPAALRQRLARARAMLRQTIDREQGSDPR